MAFTLDPPFINVSLHDLPFAAAALDRDTVIVAANHTFLQLCGDPTSSPVGQRLSHIVAEHDRPAVEEALQYLATQDNWPCQTCVMHAVRASPPILWLAISVVRLGPGSIVPYLSCLQVIARRRESDSLPDDFNLNRGQLVGQTLTGSHVEPAIGTNALDTLAAWSGLTRSVAASTAAFSLPKMIPRLTPNGGLASNNALLSQASSYIHRPAGPEYTPVESRIQHRPDAGRPRWLPWAAGVCGVLALLALLALRGLGGPIDPQLTLSNRDGHITYSGVVRDEATRLAIVKGLGLSVGPRSISGDLRIDPNVRRATWLPRFAGLFEALKTPGVDISLDGNAVKLGGWLTAVDRQALIGKLRETFGRDAPITSLGDASVEAARAANDKALTALRAIGTTGTSGTSGVSPDAVVNAMNLAVINFASGSAQITADSQEVIRRSADALKRAPAGTKVEIGGHTDNTGNPAGNLTLSQSRADAVKAALVTDGVQTAMLETKGYGDTKPRATNHTEFGRFQNRRIEYSVVR